MKITCQACEAKYTIADEKVQGKVKKMRCKKCGATIIVNGAGTATGAAAIDAGGTTYTVSVAEGDQRTMTVNDIVMAYNAGEIVGETYVWTDGMDDWLPLASIPVIVAAIEQAAAGGRSPSLLEAPAYTTEAPEGASLSTPGNPVQQAARREGGRAKVDLFGAAAMAGSEHEAPAARASRSPGSGGTSASLTGARNEQSVLFSLNALGLSSGASGTSPSSAKQSNNEDSGLIDLGALTQGQGLGDASRGTAPVLPMTPMLGAPVLGAPVFEAPSMIGSVPASARPKTGLYFAVGAGLLGIAIVAAALILSGGKKDDAATSETPRQASSQTATPTAIEAPTPPPTANAAVDPTDSGASGGAKTAPTPPAGNTRRPSGGGRAAPPSQPANNAPPATTPAPPPKPAGGSNNCGCPPGDLNCAIKCSASRH